MNSHDRTPAAQSEPMRLSLPSSLRQLNLCIGVLGRPLCFSLNWGLERAPSANFLNLERLLTCGNLTRLIFSPSTSNWDTSASSAITMSSHQPRTPANPSWIWAGIHGASGIVHPFLASRDDPDLFYCGLGGHYDHLNLVLAGSGGLLLIRRFPPSIATLFEEGNDAFRRLALLVLGVEADDQCNNSPQDDQSSLEISQQWQSLKVVNPSTHESRVLPPANSMDVGLEFWSYNGVQANLLVDTESQTYKVVLAFPDYVCLYTSTSNAWQCRRFIEGASWGPHNRVLLATPWKMMANAYVNGRLFFAYIVVDDLIPTMNLIEIDVEEASWKLHNWHYSLQTQFMEFEDTPFLRMSGLIDHGMQQHQALHTRTVVSRPRAVALQNFEIVECMGELYAVIPMSLSECLPMSLRSQRTWTEVVHEYANFGLSFMPLQFLIVNMRGDGFVHGVLRILVPEDASSIGGIEMDLMGIEERKKILTTMVGMEPRRRITWRFSCVAEGSVIWVGLLDYVLQYDVVTGVSKTEIILESPPETSLELRADRVYYRPSDMKP